MAVRFRAGTDCGSRPQPVAYCADHAGADAEWRVPAQASGIVHGDYRTSNVAFGADGAVRAVFDWELVTAGDPMANLEWLASTWQDPGEQLPPTTPGPGAVPGFPARAQLVQRYARLSGRAVSDLPYWLAFSRWRSACIGVGVRARCLARHMADNGFTGRLLTSAEPGSAGSPGHPGGGRPRRAAPRRGISPPALSSGETRPGRQRSEPVQDPCQMGRRCVDHQR
jgi:Phosphotransferase enzyme family